MATPKVDLSPSPKALTPQQVPVSISIPIHLKPDNTVYIDENAISVVPGRETRGGNRGNCFMVAYYLRDFKNPVVLQYVDGFQAAKRVGDESYSLRIPYWAQVQTIQIYRGVAGQPLACFSQDMALLNTLEMSFVEGQCFDQDLSVQTRFDPSGKVLPNPPAKKIPPSQCREYKIPFPASLKPNK